MSTPALREAMLILEDVSERFRQVLRDRPEGWRRDYIDLRKSLHDAVLAIVAAGRPTITDPERLRAFDDAHARFRYSLTLHQANWPILTVGEPDPACVASLRTVDANFIAMISMLGITKKIAL